MERSSERKAWGATFETHLAPSLFHSFQLGHYFVYFNLFEISPPPPPPAYQRGSRKNHENDFSTIRVKYGRKLGKKTRYHHSKVEYFTGVEGQKTINCEKWAIFKKLGPHPRLKSRPSCVQMFFELQTNEFCTIIQKLERLLLQKDHLQNLGVFQTSNFYTKTILHPLHCNAHNFVLHTVQMD